MQAVSFWNLSKITVRLWLDQMNGSLLRRMIAARWGRPAAKERSGDAARLPPQIGTPMGAHTGAQMATRSAPRLHPAEPEEVPAGARAAGILSASGATHGAGAGSPVAP